MRRLARVGKAVNKLMGVLQVETRPTVELNDAEQRQRAEKIASVERHREERAELAKQRDAIDRRLAELKQQREEAARQHALTTGPIQRRLAEIAAEFVTAATEGRPVAAGVKDEQAKLLTRLGEANATLAAACPGPDIDRNTPSGFPIDRSEEAVLRRQRQSLSDRMRALGPACNLPPDIVSETERATLLQTHTSITKQLREIEGHIRSLESTDTHEAYLPALNRDLRRLTGQAQAMRFMAKVVGDRLNEWNREKTA